MNLQTITDQLRDATHDKLLSLANWCQSEARLRDPVYLAEEARLDEFYKKQKEKAEVAAVRSDRIVVALKKLLKPGARIKMKGCKDRTGLREFIRWEGDNLVCWQILRRVRYVGGNCNNRVVEESHTNQVTTHVADKVQEIYVNGTGLKIKSILK